MNGFKSNTRYQVISAAGARCICAVTKVSYLSPKAVRKAVPNFGPRFKLRAHLAILHVMFQIHTSNLATKKNPGNALDVLVSGIRPWVFYVSSGSCGEEASFLFLQDKRVILDII